MSKKHTLVGGEVVINVHDPALCAGRPCPIHNVSQHSMSEFPQHFREDRGCMERICPHGVGHPDPDDIPFQIQREADLLQSVGPDEFPRGYYEFLAAGAVFVHGCDGCCA